MMIGYKLTCASLIAPSHVECTASTFNAPSHVNYTTPRQLHRPLSNHTCVLLLSMVRKDSRLNDSRLKDSRLKDARLKDSRLKDSRLKDSI